MSFCAEILSLAGEVEMKEVKDCTTKICQEIAELKVEVKESTERRYIELYPLTVDNSFLVERASDLTESLQHLQERLATQTKRDVAELNCELKDLMGSLKECQEGMVVMNKLLKVDQDYNTGRKEFTNGNFLKAAQLLSEAQKALSEDTEHLPFLEIFNCIAEEIALWTAQIVSEAEKKWRNAIRWDVIEVEKRTRTVSLLVSPETDALSDLAKTLHLYKKANFEIANLGKELMREIVRPIICSDCTTVSVFNRRDSEGLKVEVNLRGKGVNHKEVIRNLMKVFTFMYRWCDVMLNDGLSLMKVLGEGVSEECVQLLVEECLSESVPSTREGLSSFTDFLDELSSLDQYLKKLGFLDPDSTRLQDYYSTNLELLFVEKTSERYLDAGRKIMKKSLRDMKTVAPIKLDEPLEITCTIDETIGISELSANIFQFPVCVISCSAEELINLIKEILDEVVKGDEGSQKLFYTAINLFTLYMDIVPLYHRSQLETLPQVSALLHNNYMYLAHKILTLELEYKSKYPSSLSSQPSHFIHLVDPLRTVGIGILDQQLEKQASSMKDLLQGSGFLTLGDYEELPKSVEKSLDQCLRQLDILRSVWMDVLPGNVYCKVMGLLCNAFLDELITMVLATRDIRADTATQLVTIFSSVQCKVPPLFSDPQVVMKHVKRWTRFNELVRVLGASLLEIEERWSDGKGPLALEFTPDQVRHLIRALFQVSDMRAMLLSTIY